MRAQRFTSAQDDSVTSSEQFGHKFSGTTVLTNTFAMLFGFSHTVNNTNSTVVALGSGCIVNANNCVSLGINCFSGPTSGAGAGQEVALGYAASAGAGDANANAGQVAVGSTVQTRLGKLAAFGSNVQIQSTFTTDEGRGYAAGVDIGIVNSTRIVALGVNFAFANLDNVLVVGWYGATAPVFPGVVNNQIMIGNVNQTRVNIGAYTIGQSTGTTSKVNDVNFVNTGSTSVVMWTAITAGRTNTLPLASSVNAAFIVRVLDMSGNASAVNTITTITQGSDTIVGAGSPIINVAFNGKRFMSDGVSQWNQENNW